MIPEGAFDDLHNVRELNLEGNNLSTLNGPLFKNLKKLAIVELGGMFTQMDSTTFESKNINYYALVRLTVRKESLAVIEMLRNQLGRRLMLSSW